MAKVGHGKFEVVVRRRRHCRGRSPRAVQAAARVTETDLLPGGGVLPTSSHLQVQLPGQGALELELQRILDALPLAVMLIDARHHVLAANEAVYTILGVGPAQLLGRYCPTAIHGRDTPVPTCPLDQAQECGQAVDCDVFSSNTGKIFHSSAYPTPYSTPAGDRIYLHVSQDVTDQRRAEAELRQSHAAQLAINELLRIALEPLSLEQILDKVIEFVTTIPWLPQPARGAIFLVDESGEALALHASRGFSLGALQRCGRQPLGRCLCGQAAQTGCIQYGLHHANSNELPQATHGHYCVPLAEGATVVGVLMLQVGEDHREDAAEQAFLSSLARVVVNIVRRKRSEERQREHEQVAISRERLARVGEISAGVAHTIRNPLHGVLTCLEMVEGRLEGDPSAHELLALMREGLERIDHVTRRLLVLTRQEEISLRSTDVGSLLGDVLRLLEGRAHQRGVLLRAECPDAISADLDPDRFAEALSNVVGNAIDACGPAGTVVVRATVCTEPAPALVITVTDDGAGIPEDHLARVTDPFFTTKPVGEGSGLGLAIARRVLEEHGGRLEIASKPRKGTVVSLLLHR